MSHLQGLKVVRGPDWMWGDQDGGEGNVGTVYIDGSEIDQKLLRPRMVSVVWESGLKAQYRVGPKGSHDLRVSVSIPPFFLIIGLTRFDLSGSGQQRHWDKAPRDLL